MITRMIALGLMIGGAAAMAGCTTAPTYGTGKRSDVQLVEDVSNIVSLSPPKREKVAYKPRPSLVKPPNTVLLPPPQQELIAGNPAWPESPEERRARIRAEADANSDNPNFQSEIIASTPGGPRKKRRTPDRRGDREAADGVPNLTPITNPTRILASKKKKREEVNARLAEQPVVAKRRYLSDPPVEYQQTAATAPINDIGESERDKEKRRERLIKAGDRKSWRDYLPF